MKDSVESYRTRSIETQVMSFFLRGTGYPRFCYRKEHFNWPVLAEQVGMLLGPSPLILHLFHRASAYTFFILLTSASLSHVVSKGPNMPSLLRWSAPLSASPTPLPSRAEEDGEGAPAGDGDPEADPRRFVLFTYPLSACLPRPARQSKCCEVRKLRLLVLFWMWISLCLQSRVRTYLWIDEKGASEPIEFDFGADVWQSEKRSNKGSVRCWGVWYEHIRSPSSKINLNNGTVVSLVPFLYEGMKPFLLFGFGKHFVL